MPNQFPSDADGEALQRIADDGSDMAKPMAIDFFVVAPDEDSAREIAEAVENREYTVEIYEDEESGEITCYCTKIMIATYGAVVKAQEELDEVCKPFGGATDGWGTLGNG